jgi:ABC-type antimicrobial peptide transport system permease subunit
MVVRQSLGWTLAGVGLGLVAALGAGKYVAPLLFETAPADYAVFGTAAATLIVVAVTASLAPAIRASRVDPNVTLRAE